MILKVFGLLQIVQLALFITLCMCEICNRHPLGGKSESLPPDNRFVIDLEDIRNYEYIPQREYKVKLFARDGKATFIAFSIFLHGDTTPNKNNPRRPNLLHAGHLKPISNNTIFHNVCPNTIIQSDTTPKTSVEVKWSAPPKDNKCVTIFAVVAVKSDVWYRSEGPLSVRVCEDRRKADDMPPMENDNCQVCEDARYQLTFEGMWSFNTHPLMYPPPNEVARLSDIVGASHNKEFTLFKYNTEATAGLRMLAEQGNTTKMELEILQELGTNVRTVIKATAPPSPDRSSVMNFRASRKHHLVSIVTGLLPSPDWFLGIPNLELCDVVTGKWATDITLNLYPLDAGTDSGKEFNASNEETSPPQPISSAVIANIDKELIKPFARLLFKLVRTYANPSCGDQTGTEITRVTDAEGDEESREGEDEGEVTEKYQPPAPPATTTSEAPPAVDPDTTESSCPMNTWQEWEPCEGECIDGKIEGYQARFRTYHLDPTPECQTISLTEMQECQEDCEVEQDVEEELSD